jgi:tRNA-Thr(GGU) m(6)t(6)A37 methyltransferase TsaA
VFVLRPIGRVLSSLRSREQAPKQGREGAPEAWLEFVPEVQEGLADLRAGDEMILLTWLHRAERETLRVHPRDDVHAPLRGVFSTRSQDRPNPIGVHRVRILEIQGTRVRVDRLEAFDETPIIDLKPVLEEGRES